MREHMRQHPLPWIIVAILFLIGLLADLDGALDFITRWLPLIVQGLVGMVQVIGSLIAQWIGDLFKLLHP